MGDTFDRVLEIKIAVEQLKLSGVELANYIDKREAKFEEKEERRRRFDQEQQDKEEERQEKKIRFEEEKEDKRKKLELEEIEADRRRKHEWDVLRAKDEEADRARQHELQVLASQPKGDETLNQSLHAEVVALSGNKSRPKLPYFDDAKDDADAYLKRFEIYATAMGWQKADWPLNLSSLLRGAALEVYTRLSVVESNNYDKVKEALLRHYQMTEDGFRRKFFVSRPQPGETATQFSSRLSNYFDRWSQMAKINKTYDAVRNLLIREQFIHGVQVGMSTFLRERNLTSLDDVVLNAERYADAHGLYRKGGKTGIGSVRSPTMGRKNGKPQDSQTKPDSHSSNNQPSSTDNRQGGKPSSRGLVCHRCGTPGHIAPNCPQVVSNQHHRGINAACLSPKKEPTIFKTAGKLEGVDVDVTRDTCATVSLAREELVPKGKFTGEFTTVQCYAGDQHVHPLARIEVECPYYSGELLVAVLKEPPASLVIGNEASISNPTVIRSDEVSAVTTRAQKTKGVGEPLIVLAQLPEVGPDDVKKQQEEDVSLSQYFRLVDQPEPQKLGINGKQSFEVRRGLLHRIYQSPKVNLGDPVVQLVVPKGLRVRVMGLAHDSLLSGHMGTKRTTDRLTMHFYWPGIHGDVTRYCRSCDICQRTIYKGKVPVARLEKMPLVETPFKHVSCDLVGPIFPASNRGNRYILTVIDFATRYPECVALSSIDTVHVAEALVSIFSRVGVPEKILSDRGTQFTSDMMGEVARLLSLQQLTTTPYHAMANGLVERFQGTLKQMLKRLCAERQQDWDRYLEPLLFAYREIPQESLKFSPFELLYGRTIRGPMAILKELWSKPESDDDQKTSYQYVLDLQERLERSSEIAQQHLASAQAKQHHYFNRKAKHREMKAGDLALILLPTHSNKLQMQWRGPFEVVERHGPTGYRLKVRGKIKTYHINMLKQYVPREKSRVLPVAVVAAAVAIVEEEVDSSLKGNAFLLDQSYSTGAKESFLDCHVNPELSPANQGKVSSLLQEFQDIFSDEPGLTDLVEHSITLTSDKPIRQKPYPVPQFKVDVIRKELDEMLRLGVVERSNSPYCSPIVLVAKPDGSVRVCIDFRRINQVTVFDCEPTPDPEAIFAKLSSASFMSKADCSKGYWQIPLRTIDKPISAFGTPFGLFQFTTMPFGLQNACATYSRMMRLMLDGMDHVDNFVDDILTHNHSFSSHLTTLRELFERVRKAKIRLRPSKCYFAYQSVEYLGHEVGLGMLKTLDDKVQKLKNCERPTTKTTLRSYLGFASYYRKFVPNFSTVVFPLTELLKNKCPNELCWGADQERAFLTIRDTLCSGPVLRLPDFTKIFYLRTDASAVGIGAVLLQSHDDTLFPVLYVSRKLRGAETNYTVSEKECLAIVWAVDKLRVYLYGKEFVIQTDHCPLTYLNHARFTNSRLMRWSLGLQPFRYRIEYIKGENNVGADFLSRCGGSPECASGDNDVRADTVLCTG